MDFIERILHISPDHGNGMFETAILLAVVVIPLAFAAVARTVRNRHL